MVKIQKQNQIKRKKPVAKKELKPYVFIINIFIAIVNSLIYAKKSFNETITKKKSLHYHKKRHQLSFI